ncbi:hypothetical protein DL240_18635 [Lujinxingia litoralis]|uniref:Right handed beta helix domain-containing protein n=1 Tax=Lujinxingia litoralis TaxID=2211119 RepID=A0A328C2W3_9DELT|nr:hypothetical protein [Lujinxingia litoralis]RAL20127.1 hypothetical protein DL240_18635 [Lujinxingia litoralis]
MRRSCLYLLTFLSPAIVFSTACFNTESPPSERARVTSATLEPGQALTTCNRPQSCHQGFVCTQGGHCVDPTGQVSATAALQADFDNLPTAVGLGVPYELPPNARLRLDDPDGDGIALQVTNPIILQGQGSELVVENGVIALRISAPADWSSVRDLSFVPTTPSQPHQGIGIDVRAHGLRLDNLFFDRMGTGIRAHSIVDGQHANLNIQQWSRLVFWECHEHAMHLAGGDTNAGLFTGLEVRAGNGILDSSFLGNTYISPTINSTTVDALTLDSSASSATVLGAYTEINAPLMRANSFHDLHLGGNAIDRLDSEGDRIGRHHASLRFRDPQTGLRVRIPGASHAALAFHHPNDGEWWYLRYFDEPSRMMWGFSYRNTSTSAYRWTGHQHPQGPALYQAGTPLNTTLAMQTLSSESSTTPGGPPAHAPALGKRAQTPVTPDPNWDGSEPPRSEDPYFDITPDEDAFFWEGMSPP